ncbi:trk system potassium uptake protein TrkH [Bacillus mesophilus]|uniref:Ktr system potassium transporter B n=1 Tax=Bacillus mesophilus TaxID=1808955 RepID=A0A6M0QAE2_9BACI|nr:TrkH family potassium uptake protein [Bacillus mesophilus]MBM7661922.1 trk system potassium uptake protein TrkH [Bacillus mesophilus]NEY72719.1 Ktr system potassium transporter B [Bacillus mesophilus]
MINRKWIKMNPSQLLVLVFSVFILLGTILLKLPIATNNSITWLDALFTATSAMTVTGLVVFDTGTVYTTFGEVVILCLIQIGGLGIMSFAVLIFMVLGRKIGMKERILVQQALNQTSLGGVINLVKYLFIFSFSIELIAMMFLAIRWVPEYGWGDGLYYSLFHAVSAFNNAGFGLWPDNLISYVGDPIVNIVISLLFIIGGIGFTVLLDLKNKNSFKRLSLHTKLMLWGSLLINVFAMMAIFFIEYNNPHTLGSLSFMEKIWASYFQGVAPRTAGFNTLDLAALKEPTILLIIILMFIGAGSGSTGGGIKLTTFILIVFSVISFLKGREDIVVLRRTIKERLIVKALSISVISLLFVMVGIFILSLTENAPLLFIFFEVVSAFGTVGLTLGLTYTLTPIGKIVIIIVMFFGKLGPLTMVYSLGKPKKEKIKYPSEDVLTG